MAKVKELSLIAYITVAQVAEVLENKIDQIEQYVYILHDKDVYSEKECTNPDTGEIDVDKLGTLKPPHIHIYLKTVNSRQPAQIANWFKLKNADGVLQNCMREYVKCKSGLIDYMLHRTKNSESKFQYDEKDLITYNLDKYDVNDLACDDCFQIINSILDNVPTIELVKRYGRDFVYHFDSYKNIAKQVFLEEIQRKTDEKTQNIIDSVVEIPIFKGDKMPFEN